MGRVMDGRALCEYSLCAFLIGTSEFLLQFNRKPRALPKRKNNLLRMVQKVQRSFSHLSFRHPNSCAAKVGGNDTCVGDRPRS